MEDKRVSPEELEAVMAEEVKRLCVEVAEAMNAAQPGRIFAELIVHPLRSGMLACAQQTLENGAPTSAERSNAALVMTAGLSVIVLANAAGTQDRP